MISPICDTLRVRTTCPGMIFRRVVVSAASLSQPQRRFGSAYAIIWRRPGPWTSSDLNAEDEATFSLVVRLVARGRRTVVVNSLNRGIVGAG